MKKIRLMTILATLLLVVFTVLFSGFDIYRSWDRYSTHRTNAELMEKSLSRL